jgi:adenine-specific DNA-methyltransferase
MVKREFARWINGNNTLSGGEKAYRYIDGNGHVYQSVSLRAPEPRVDEKFHRPLIHPLSGKLCAVPPNGFSRTPETLAAMMERGEILFGDDESTQPRQKAFLKVDTIRQLTSLIQDAMKGKNYTSPMGLDFPYCHPVSLYELIFSVSAHESDIVLDYFGGSGTTGHAVISLNREDAGNRKYVMVEMGNHFDTATKPRIQKVVYSKDWKGGKPVSREGISHCFKTLRLESYEDTLNNLILKSNSSRNAALANNADLQRDYLLNYFLDVETQASQSLLNISDISDPTGL